MWYIQIALNITNNTPCEFTSLQILEKHIKCIYDSIQCISNEDYKILNNSLQNHIVKYINNMSAYKIELFVYNYGIDNAILLLNNYNNDNKKYINTSSKSLLFIIFYNMFTICYITNYYFSLFNLSYVINICSLFLHLNSYILSPLNVISISGSG